MKTILIDDTPFYDALKIRVRAYFQKNGVVVGYRANLRQWIHLMVHGIAVCCTLRGFIRGEFLPMILLPFFYWLFGSSCMHDGSHFSLSRFPWVNRLFAAFGGAHMSPLSWQTQHSIGHHMYTSMAGSDPDLYHFCALADGLFPGFRTSIEMRTLPERTNDGTLRSAWWRRGFCLRVPLSTFGVAFIWDFVSLLFPELEQAFLGTHPYRQLSIWRLGVHSIGRSVVLWFAIIHPIAVRLVIASNWLFGVTCAILFMLIPYGIHGCLFYVFTGLNHVQDECFSNIHVDETDRRVWHHDHPIDKVELHKRRMDQAKTLSSSSTCHEDQTEELSIKPAESGTRERIGRSQHALNTQAEVGGTAKPSEWAVHQLQHAFNYALSSPFWLHASIGLNHHATHHLFPQIGWGHYLALAPIIQEVCDQFDVKLHVATTFGEALKSHWHYIKSINDEPNASVWVRPPIRHAPEMGLNWANQIDGGWLYVPF